MKSEDYKRWVSVYDINALYPSTISDLIFDNYRVNEILENGRYNVTIINWHTQQWLEKEVDESQWYSQYHDSHIYELTEEAFLILTLKWGSN